MGKLSTIISVAALAGLGYYVGKKVFDKKKAEDAERAERIANGEIDESELFVEETHSSPKEKLQRASLFAVGAIKTGTEKFKEGIDEIINADMISKGETTMTEVKEFAADKKEKTAAFVAEKKEQTSAFVSEAKEKTVNFANGAAENIKNEIDNLKNMVTSINSNPGEVEDDIVDIDMADIAEDADEGIPAEDIEVKIEEIVEEVDEIPAAEEIEEVKADAAEAIAEYRAEFAEATDEASEQLDQLNDKAEEIAEEIEAAADEIEEAAEEAVEEVKEEADEVISSVEIEEPAFEEAEEETEDLDDVNLDTVSVDTFDFSAADQL